MNKSFQSAFINNQIKKLLLLCSGSNLDKKDLFSESDPFFTVSRINPDDSYTVVYRSDYIKDEPAPSWPPVTITSDKLCNGDWNRRLKVEIFDYNDRYVQSGPSSMSYLDPLVAVFLYTYPHIVALQEDIKLYKDLLQEELGVLHSDPLVGPLVF